MAKKPIRTSKPPRSQSSPKGEVPRSSAAVGASASTRPSRSPATNGSRSRSSTPSSPSAPLRPSSAPSAIGSSFRTEKDTMGEMQVPSDALYGASTQRAVLNFPVSGRTVPLPVITAYATLKAACATVNNRLGRLDGDRTRAITEACREVSDGLPGFGGLARHFPVDIYQTGSGTSTNMNANEVIANIICLRRHAPIGSSKDPAYIAAGGVHPNDHVNMGQSSNDTFPTAMHIAAAVMIKNELLPAIKEMAQDLDAKAKAWDKIVKIGRTHLQDATPIRLGQEFSGYASQLHHAEERLHRALHTLSELAIGGTAVGTGINCHEDFGRLVAAELTKQTGVHFREAQNHFEAQHAKDAYVEASGIMKTIAVSLSKIANDIRWLGSGPRCGIGELVLPAVQPGSSIMPGKTNPVICEALIMVCCQVIGNDTAITYGGFGGVGSLLDLNVAMPMMAHNLLDSIHLTSNACQMFSQKLLRQHEHSPGLLPDEAKCKSLIEGSLAMCTSLVPVIGYDKSAALAKEAFKQGKTVRQLAYETVVGQAGGDGKKITKQDIDTYLDPWSMTLPGGEGSAGG
ncbi:MAG TPA: class II fumarate hydratase [Phycisphaerales bacterium]|nr:class II fumarate hydratase [Phycisphaerales bacterium]